jgi:hypothetical protein
VKQGMATAASDWPMQANSNNDVIMCRKRSMTTV